MRLSEITKDEFLTKLKDPKRTEAKEFAKTFLSQAKDIGWELKGLRREGRDWVVQFHNEEALKLDDWIYESVLRDTIKILRRINDNGTWDARPNTRRTIEVYF